MSILALDLGTRLGFALHAHGHITTGFVDFKNDRYSGGGMRYLRFRRWLDEIHNTSPLTEIAFEEVRAHKGVDAAHVYGGFLAQLTAWGEEFGVPYRGVPVGQIKKFATGKGNAPKEAMIKAAQQQRSTIQDDNEADAYWLLRLALEDSRQSDIFA